MEVLAMICNKTVSIIVDKLRQLVHKIFTIYNVDFASLSF